MKLIKLLLIGLLSVGALLACEANGTYLTNKKVQAPPLAIVGIANQLPPELFQNVTIKIRAIDKNGNTVKSATWEITGINKDVVMGEVTADGTTTLKVTSADAKGTITAKAKIGDKKFEAVYEVVTSDNLVTKIDVSPTNPTIALNDSIANPALQFKAFATFGSTKIDVTDDVLWTIAGETEGMTVDSESNKGLVGVTSVVDNSSIKATFTSGIKEVFGETNVFSAVAVIKEIIINGAPEGVSIKKDESVQLSAIAYFKALADNVTTPIPIDVTNDALWSSSTSTIVKVGNTVDINKGLATIVANSGDAIISALFSEITGNITLTAGLSAKDNFIISTTIPGYLNVGSIDQLQTTEIIDGEYQTIKDVVKGDGYSCESSDPIIATVDDSCIVTAVKIGEAIITVTNNNTGSVIFDPSFYDIKIEVTGILKSIAIEIDTTTPAGFATSYDLPVKRSIKLKAIGTFSNGIYDDVTKDITNAVNWTSSDIYLVTIDNETNKGHVTAKTKGGTSIITASLSGKEGVISGTFDIKIISDIVLVTITANSPTVAGVPYDQVLTTTDLDGKVTVLSYAQNYNYLWTALVNGVADRALAVIKEDGKVYIGAKADKQPLVITAIYKGFPDVKGTITYTVDVAK